MAIKLIGI